MGFLDRIRNAANRALARGRASAQNIKAGGRPSGLPPRKPKDKPKDKPKTESPRDRRKRELEEQRRARQERDKQFLQTIQNKVLEKIRPEANIITKEDAAAIAAAQAARDSGSKAVQEKAEAELIRRGITTRDIQRTLQERPEILLGTVTDEDKRREASRIASNLGVTTDEILRNPEFNKQWKQVEIDARKSISQGQKESLAAIEAQESKKGFISKFGEALTERGLDYIGTGKYSGGDLFKPSLLKPKETVGLGLTTIGGFISGIGKPLDVGGEAFKTTDSDLLSKLEAGTRAAGKEVVSGTVGIVKDVPKVFIGPTAGFSDKQFAALNIQRLTGAALLATPTFKVGKGAVNITTAPFKSRTRGVAFRDQPVYIQTAEITSLRTGKTTAKATSDIKKSQLVYTETPLIDLKKGTFGRKGKYEFKEVGKGVVASDIRILDVTPEGAKVLTISKPFKEIGTSKQPAAEIALVKDIGKGYDITRGTFKAELTPDSPILKTGGYSGKLRDYSGEIIEPIEIGGTKLSFRGGLSKIEGQPITAFKSTLIETPRKKKSGLGRLDLSEGQGGTIRQLKQIDSGAILEQAAGQAASKVKIKTDVNKAITNSGKTFSNLQTQSLTKLKTGTTLAVVTGQRGKQLQQLSAIQLTSPLTQVRTDTIALQKTSLSELTTPLQQVRTSGISLSQLAKPTAPSLSGLTPLASLGGIPFGGKIPELGGGATARVKKNASILKGKRKRVASITAAALGIKATKKQAKKKKGFTGLEIIGLK